MNPKRYDLNDYGHGAVEMELSEDGEYVKHDEYLKFLNAYKYILRDLVLTRAMLSELTDEVDAILRKRKRIRSKTNERSQ